MASLLAKQALVHEELNRVFDGSDRPITMADLSELKYLECCIKEALRIFPSVPMFSRQLSEDTDICAHIRHYWCHLFLNFKKSNICVFRWSQISNGSNDYFFDLYHSSGPNFLP